MIEFHAGSNPASQAVSIMLEEAALEYVAPSEIADRNTAPQIRIGGADGATQSLTGAADSLEALARVSGRFLAKEAEQLCLGRLRWAEEVLVVAQDQKAPSAPAEQLAQMEGILQSQIYLAGDEISIADFAAYPLILPLRRSMQERESQDWPKVREWIDRLSIRPALARGFAAIS